MYESKQMITLRGNSKGFTHIYPHEILAELWYTLF